MIIQASTIKPQKRKKEKTKSSLGMTKYRLMRQKYQKGFKKAEQQRWTGQAKQRFLAWEEVI